MVNVAVPQEILIELVEYEEKLLPKISKELADAINQTGFIKVEPTFGDESLFRADSKIGIIRIGELQIKVMPKFPVKNLFYLLGLHEGIAFDRNLVDIKESNDITNLIFESFLKCSQKSTSRGLLTGYRQLEETSQVLHGRILITEQLRKRFGHMYPVEISYDNFTENISENIELNMAIIKSLKYGNLNDIQLLEYRHLSRKFAFIDKELGNLKWNFTRHNSHYWNSLVLADLINSGKGFFENYGDIRVSGFTVDMYRVFEKFLLKELKSRVEKKGGVVESKYLTLDLDNRQKAQIDILWKKDGKIRFIADAKYKDPDLVWESDLYQVNTYATAFSLESIHLIYARPVDESPLQLKGNATKVYRHGIDLSLPVDQIRIQIDQLAEIFVG